MPQEDSSLLFINSGMAPMKKFFLNLKTPPRRRIVTSQRCIRTGDLQRVGKTDRHGTFFEMLGNFSFGDYFKKEAIEWAWEFMTKVLKIPLKRLYVTVYEKDDETYNIWLNEIKLEKDHIKKLGKEDNFWEIGLGPCGPCSEIYFDRGEEFGCHQKECGPGCECDRFIEVWNLVFSQYEKKENEEYVELLQKNIDTGMGLERLATVMQGVKTIFEVDSVKKILQRVCEIAKIEYKKNEDDDVLIRIITDHIRSIVFLINDGVFPSNEGQGYVLRRLIRRAHKSGRMLNITNNFLADLVELFDDEEIIFSNLDYIKKVILKEEENFENILTNCEDKLIMIFNKLKEEQKSSVIDFKEFSKRFDDCFLKLQKNITNFFSELDQKFLELLEYGESDYDKHLNFLDEYFNQVKEINDVFGLLDEELKKSSIKDDLEDLKENVNEIKSFFCLDLTNLKKDYEKKLIEFKNLTKKTLESFIKQLKSFVDILKLGVKKDKDLASSGFVKMIFKIFDILNYKDFKALKRLEIPADTAFKLCDTYGMPFDVLQEMAEQNGFDVDEEGFLKLMQEQKEKSKKASHFKSKGWKENNSRLNSNYKTEFLGYFNLECIAKVEEVFEKEDFKFGLILDKTTIFAESGGQIADSGLILDPENRNVLARVENCENFGDGCFIHTINDASKIKLYDEVLVCVDEIKREKIARNHTTAHILHKILIMKFGEHVKQAGQFIDDFKIRFDFTHFEAVSKKDLKEIQNLVNDIILKALPVTVYEQDLKTAKEEGAIGLFDEKYHEIVRVVKIGDFSKELCAGTHVKNTKDIGVFKILSENSSGAGVRRIEAITSMEVLNYLNQVEESLTRVCDVFKVKKFDEIEVKAKDLTMKFKENKEQLSKMKLDLCESQFCGVFDSTKQSIGRFQAVVFDEELLDKKELRVFADCLKSRMKFVVALVFVEYDFKFNILVICGEESVKAGALANEIIQRLVKIVDGHGGGKKDFAMAGIHDFTKKKELTDLFYKILKEIGGEDK